MVLQRRALVVNVLLTGAPTTPLAEGYVVGMEGSPTLQRKKESAKGMGQSTKHALMKDAPTKSSEEESAAGTGQRAKYALMMDAPAMPRVEEFAVRTGQNLKCAVMKDAPTKCGKEGSA